MNAGLAGESSCWLRSRAIDSPDAIALIDGDGQLSFAQLDELVTTAASALRSLDGPVALLPDLDRSSIVVLLALIRNGTVACLLNRRHPGSRLREQMRHLGSRTLICHGEPPSGMATTGVQVIDRQAWGAIVQAPDRTDLPLPMDDPALILFTSASTGQAKAAVLSLRNLYVNALASNRRLRLTTHSAWLMALPLYHVGGLGILFRCLAAGAAMVIRAPGERWIAHPGGRRLTHVSMVPTQLMRLLRDDTAWPALAALHVLLLGGAPAPDALVELAIQRGIPVCKTYGLTEASSQVTTVEPGDTRQLLTAGRALDCCEVKTDATGEIWIRGATIFLGYHRPDGIESMVDGDRWLATGDLGELTDDGVLTVTGRKDNLFISGGENIQPEEIEQELCNLPGIEEAVVVPIHDDEFGQRPIAFIKTDGSPMDAASWQNALRARLAKFMVPVDFRAWPGAADTDLKRNRAYFCDLANSRILP